VPARDRGEPSAERWQREPSRARAKPFGRLAAPRFQDLEVERERLRRGRQWLEAVALAERLEECLSRGDSDMLLAYFCFRGAVSALRPR